MNSPLPLVLPLAALALLLALAVWHDVRTRRIPNRLVLAGLLCGLALNTMLPAGAGLFSDPAGALGPIAALAGAAVGLIALLPLYALGAMGAGDVKLMAMVGAFLGPQSTVGAALLSLLAGGLLARAGAGWTGSLSRALRSTRSLLADAIVRRAGIGAEKPAASIQLAYAIAISGGTSVNIFLTSTHGWSLLS